MRTAVIVPTYNEARNIASLAGALLALPVVTWLIIVDDNSPDGTGDLADALQRQTPERVHVIHRAAKQGLGTAYLAGFAQARALGAHRVITMDADGSHDPAVIPALLDASRHADLVIGSRYVPGGGTCACWGWHRRLLSAWANRITHLALGLRACDTTSGYRCYAAELLRQLPLDRIRSNGYSYLVEILYHAQRLGATVDEVPILFQDRRHGASKLSRIEILHAMGTVARLTGDRLSRGRHRSHAPGTP